MKFDFSWLLVLVGVVFVGVIAEMIIPHRRVGSAVRISIMIVLVSVLFSSIVGVLKDGEKQVLGEVRDEVAVNESYYIDMVENLEVMAERKVSSQLGIPVDIFIDFDIADFEIQFLSVGVELLNGYGSRSSEEIVAIVCDVVDVDKKEVFIYEREG